MPVVEVVNKAGAVNHFEKTHPKDDFEMLHAHVSRTFIYTTISTTGECLPNRFG